MRAFQLARHQQAALERLQAFTLEQGSRCFVLRGYAGTGKAALTGGLGDEHTESPVGKVPASCRTARKAKKTYICIDAKRMI